MLKSRLKISSLRERNSSSLQQIQRVFHVSFRGVNITFGQDSDSESESHTMIGETWHD